MKGKYETRPILVCPVRIVKSPFNGCADHIMLPKTLKAVIQGAIDSGEITTMSQLSDRIAAHDLVITRNGYDYLGLREPNGKRFRVRFLFANDTRQSKTKKLLKADDTVSFDTIKGPRGVWIYVLTAQSFDGKRKACYVGQTVNLKRRFREHLRCNRPGHSSYTLFKWATHEGVEVHATVLVLVDGNQSYASRFEGYWLKMAIEAGFEAPDSHNWGRLPLPVDPVGQPDQWPVSQILAASVPISQLVESSTAPTELFFAPRIGISD